MSPDTRIILDTLARLLAGQQVIETQLDVLLTLKGISKEGRSEMHDRVFSNSLKIANKALMERWEKLSQGDSEEPPPRWLIE